MDELELRLTSLHLQSMTGDSPEAVPESELAVIESALGAQLPDDYRWFLRRYGESLFREAVAVRTSDGETVPFMHFYGANASGDGVLKNYQFHEGEFPSGFVPIGEGSFGDLYLLAGNGPHRGSVYYWCHDAGGWDSEDQDYSGFELALQRAIVTRSQTEPLGAKGVMPGRARSGVSDVKCGPIDAVFTGHGLPKRIA